MFFSSAFLIIVENQLAINISQPHQQHGSLVMAVASRRGGLPEIVIEGQTGFMFDPDQPADLENLLNIIIERPELLSFMQESVRKHLAQFEKEHSVQEYEKIYEAVTSR